MQVGAQAGPDKESLEGVSRCTKFWLLSLLWPWLPARQSSPPCRKRMPSTTPSRHFSQALLRSQTGKLSPIFPRSLQIDSLQTRTIGLWLTKLPKSPEFTVPPFALSAAKKQPVFRINPQNIETNSVTQKLHPNSYENKQLTSIAVKASFKNKQLTSPRHTLDFPLPSISHVI